MPKPSKVALVESSTSTASEKPVRRSFTAADKIRIMREAELCLEPGALGELLRREGAGPSRAVLWRTQQGGATLVRTSEGLRLVTAHGPSFLTVRGRGA